MPWDWIVLALTLLVVAVRVVANVGDRPSEPCRRT